jgi:hypothetical protein
MARTPAASSSLGDKRLRTKDKTVKRKREIATGLLILAIATVFGQQTTPPPDQAKPDEKKDEQTTKATEAPKISLDLGASHWGISGNENKFRQYATPPKGFFIRSLSYAPTYLDRHDAYLDIKAPWQDDYRLDGTVRLNNGTTYLNATDHRNRFFNPDPSLLEGNERHITAGAVRQKITPGFGLSFSSRLDQQDGRFPAPLDPMHQRTRIWNASAKGSLWRDGFVDLSYTDWRYWDRTNILPDTDMQTWSAGLMHQFGDNFSLNGTYSRSMIHQPSIGDTNKIEAWSAGGNYLLGDSTTIIGEIRNEKLTLPTVENAYDRSRQLTRGRIVHSFGAGWSGQFGYSRLALERVNDAHTFVDVPKWHTFDAQFSGRLSPSLRLTARGSRATMDGSASMETEDPRALYWRNRWSTEVKLDATGELMSGYVVFGLHDDRNDVRDVHVRNQSLTFGGTFQVKPEVELYFESSYELWSGVTSDPLNPDLNQFFPDGTTFTVGSNWTINDKAYATANYTLFNTSNDNPLGLPGGNVRGSQLTAAFHYKTPAGYELGLTFAPWAYSDRLYANRGYNTGLIQVTAKARF